MLRQIVWGVQNGPITKNYYYKKLLLQKTASNCFIFFEICFSFRTVSVWLDELNWIDSNVHIHTFHKRWSFIRRCFFPLTNLNHANLTNSTSLSTTVTPACEKHFISSKNSKPFLKPKEGRTPISRKTKLVTPDMDHDLM